jgi:hypothetical protein
MEIRLNEQVQRTLQAKAAESHFASVEAVLLRDAEQNMDNAADALARFHMGLRQSGLLLLDPKPMAHVPGEPFEPIAISGEPLSTTIITEGR